MLKMIKKFKGNKEERDRQRGFVKEIKKVFSRSQIPSRGSQKYNFVNTFKVNCLEHAFFNFTNKEIRKISREFSHELFEFLWIFEALQTYMFYSTPTQVYNKIHDELIDKIKSVGLKIEDCLINEELKDNQWKVAFYFNPEAGEEDFHFMRQEKDGTWSSKAGKYMKVQKFDEPPELFRENYQLVKFFKVTNSCFSKDIQDELEF